MIYLVLQVTEEINFYSQGAIFEITSWYCNIEGKLQAESSCVQFLVITERSLCCLSSSLPIVIS